MWLVHNSSSLSLIPRHSSSLLYSALQAHHRLQSFRKYSLWGPLHSAVKYQLHHGLNGLQGNVCPGTRNTSYSSFFSHLGAHRAVSHICPQSSLLCIIFHFLKCLFLDLPHLWLNGLSWSQTQAMRITLSKDHNCGVFRFQ